MGLIDPDTKYRFLRRISWSFAHTAYYRLSVDEVDDVVQEACLALYQIDDDEQKVLPSDEAELRALTVGVTHNMIRRHLRATGRRLEEYTDDDFEFPEMVDGIELLMDNEEAQSLIEAVGGEDKTNRSILVGIMAGLSLSRIGELLGLGKSTVHERLNKMRIEARRLVAVGRLAPVV